jgi:uncharacterized membrane protein YbhN (UPF0104 family)
MTRFFSFLVASQRFTGDNGLMDSQTKAKRFLPFVGLIVFCLAFYLLYRAIRQYDSREIVESLYAVSLPHLVLGALFAAGSYFSLTFFDFLACRYIDAKLPYRRIALASFCALSIGHTLGLAAVSTGAIRYRFYSLWGISSGDVAKIIAFCAMTVGLGLNTLGGVALLLQSEIAAKILGLSQGLALAVGGVCVALTALYVSVAAMLRRRLIGRIAMPPLNLALAQITAGTINFGFVAAALHQMIRSTSDTGYLTVATVYILGNVASLISHVPGGLGVLETVVIYLVPQASVVGALVAFRVIYYLVPFAIGASVFAVHELAERRRARVPAPASLER